MRKTHSENQKWESAFRIQQYWGSKVYSITVWCVLPLRVCWITMSAVARRFQAAQRSRSSGATAKDSCLITLIVPIPLTWLTWILLLLSSATSRCMSTNIQSELHHLSDCLYFIYPVQKKDQQETVLSCHSAEVKTDVPLILWWCVLPVHRLKVSLFCCLKHLVIL